MRFKNKLSVLVLGYLFCKPNGWAKIPILAYNYRHFVLLLICEPYQVNSEFYINTLLLFSGIDSTSINLNTSALQIPNLRHPEMMPKRILI